MMLTATAKLDRLLITKAVLKEVIAELEGSLGIEEALPVTVAVAKAIDAADRMAERVKGGGS